MPRARLLVLFALNACNQPSLNRSAAPARARVSSTAAATLGGTLAKSYFGYSISSAGDVNADGYGDLIVGAWATDSYKGEVTVYHGGASGIGATPDLSISARLIDLGVGFSVSGAGDVNGDGFDDVIVGSPFSDSFVGYADVYLGSARGLSSRSVATLAGTVVYDQLGASVAGAGDVNGDGFDDVIVGAPGDETLTGRALVFLGNADGLESTPVVEWSGLNLDDIFGQHVAGVGDLNNDGYDDVAVSAPHVGSNSGEVSVYLGGPDGPSETPLVVLRGEAEGDYLGWRAEGAGDLNGDGYDDLVVGACGLADYTGAVIVYYGGADGVDPGRAVTISGDAPDEAFGISVASAGDVNGDGYADLMVGASLKNDATGEARLYQGSASGLDVSAAVTLSGGAVNDLFGGEVAGVGDLDGDGFDDVAVGAYGANAYRGEVTIYAGYDEGDEDGDGVPVELDCDDTDEAVGGPDTWYSDGDGDGYGDPASATDACSPPDGAVAVAGDCDDLDAASAPDQAEVCDGADNDCDGEADEDALDPATFYADADGDGFGDAEVSTSACAAPSGFTDDATDCDDGDGGAFPGAEEIAGDGVDQDCDGEDLAADPAGDDTGTAKEAGCGCASGGGSGGGLLSLGLVGLALGRRRG